VQRGEISHEQHEQRIPDHHREVTAEPPPSHVLEHEQLHPGHVQGKLTVESLIDAQLALGQALERVPHLPQAGDFPVDRIRADFRQQPVIGVLAQRRGGDRVASQKLRVEMSGDRLEACMPVDGASSHTSSCGG
jgi:hypothetical protein